MKYLMNIMILLVSLYVVSVSQTRVTQSISSPREPSLAVNPTDQNNIIILYTTDAGIGCSRTTNGGVTWTLTSENISGLAATQSDPFVTFDGAGIAYCSFVKVPADGYAILHFQKSTDGGITWSSVKTIDPAINGYADRPWLYVQQTPNADGQYGIFIGYAIIGGNPPNPTSIRVIYSSNGGYSFDIIKTFAGGTGKYQGCTIAVKDNTVYVAFGETDNNYAINNLHIESATIGTWTFSQITTGLIPVSEVGIKGSGGFWYMLKGFIRVDSCPKMDIDPITGRIYITWADNGAGNPEIYVVNGIKSGSTYSFSPPQNITSTALNVWDFAPAISVHPDGVISFLYYRCDSLWSIEPIEVHVATYHYNQGLIKDDDQTVNVIPSFKENQFTGNNVFLGDYFGLGSSIGKVYAGWIEYRKVVDPSELYRQAYFKSLSTVTATPPAGYSKVIVSQQDAAANDFGSFGRWRVNKFVSYKSPQSFVLSNTSTTEVIRADQTVQQLNPFQKYNKWNGYSSVANHQQFGISSPQAPIIGSFQPTNDATLQAQLLDGGSIGGVVNFKDPWYIDTTDSYGQRNQGMSDWHHQVSYLQNNVGTTTNYKGVFLNQLVQDGIYYSVNAPTTQPINNISGYFLNWSGTNISPSTSTSQTLPIVFTGNNAIVTANYKASLASNTSTAIANSSQRKIVRTAGGTNGVLHFVYESMGYVWYETSADNGATWILMNNNQPISGYGAKLPSLATPNQALYGITPVIIAFQEGSNLRVLCFKNSNNGTTFNFASEASQLNIKPNIQNITNANPAVGVTYLSESPYVFVVWEGLIPVGITNHPKGLQYWGAFLLNNSQSFDVGTTGYITNATTSSSNPTIAPTSYGIFHLAWQEGTTAIQYKSITGGSVQNSTINVSYSDGYTENYAPSIVSSSDNTRISWVGKRWVDGGGGGGLGKTNAGGGGGYYEYATIFRKSETPNTYWSFGSSVISTNIGSYIDGSDNFIVAWSQSNLGGSNLYTRNTTLGGTIVSFKKAGQIINGKDVQVVPGTTWSNMYGIIQGTQGMPYPLKLSDNITTLGKTETASGVFKGRQGCIEKDTAQFYFTFGDVTVDGTLIDFEEKPDSVLIDNANTLNTYLTTKPFALTNASNFLYDVQYGFSDSAFCETVLRGTENVAFKVQLLDATTDALIGEFDQVAFHEGNIFQHDNIGYQVNTQGIGSRTVRLRLVVNTTLNAHYSITQRFDTEPVTGLGKDSRSRTQINFKGKNSVSDYSLDQNYPNPFNPTTTINYALPKAGNVVLKVYDVLGKEVATLVNNFKESGRYSVEFDASKLSSGMYVYKIISGSNLATKKMLLLK